MNKDLGKGPEKKDNDEMVFQITMNATEAKELIKNFFSPEYRRWSILGIFIFSVILGATVYLFLISDNPPPTTSMSQSIGDGSHGNTQIQGNVQVTTDASPPRLSFQIIEPSVRKEDGRYHTKFRFHIGVPPEQRDPNAGDILIHPEAPLSMTCPTVVEKESVSIEWDGYYPERKVGTFVLECLSDEPLNASSLLFQVCRNEGVIMSCPRWPGIDLKNL